MSTCERSRFFVSASSFGFIRKGTVSGSKPHEFATCSDAWRSKACTTAASNLAVMAASEPPRMPGG
eukprot:6141770-Prymnesium_polylepis.1